MSSIQIYNSTPGIHLTGIQDLSGRTVTPENESLPQHLPLFFIFSEKGSEKDVWIVGSGSLKTTYGDKLLDYTSKYATIASPFIEGLVAKNNLIMVQRLKPTGAQTAWIRFSLGIREVDMVDGASKITTRKTTGVEADGFTPIYSETEHDSIKGYELRWVVELPQVNTNLLESLSSSDQNVYSQSVTFGNALTVNNGLNEISKPVTSPIAAGIAAQFGDTAGDVNLERLYPIMDLEVKDFGDFGNNVGLRFACYNQATNTKANLNFFEKTYVRPYSVSVVRRNNRRSSPVVIRNILGEDVTGFVFKPRTLDAAANNEDMYLESRMIENYQNLDTTGGRIPTYGPFGRVKVYDDNVSHIFKTLYDRERQFEEEFLDDDDSDWTVSLTDSRVRFLVEPTDSEDLDLQDAKKYQLDIFTAKNLGGFPYRTFRMARVNVASNSFMEQMVDTTDHWCSGGSDGEMTVSEYNRLVAAKIEEMTDEHSEWTDLARYPYSVFYDVGYPQYVKELFPELIRARKDVSIALATHSIPDANDPTVVSSLVKTGNLQDGVRELSREEEVGMVTTLARVATQYPESEIYGTKSVRANIIMHCGNVVIGDYKGKVPGTYELAMKRADFMGNRNGAFRDGYGYDQDGFKQVKYMKLMSNVFTPKVQRERNWTKGASWVQYYDHRTPFFPAIRTVYSDETSVLVSDINMLIATDLEKVCFRVWRKLVGNAKLTNAQFIELSDRYILEDVDGRYDGRVTIIPETYYTAGDEQRGYSWHCKIHAYMNNMKTVGVFTVVTHRQEELEK